MKNWNTPLICAVCGSLLIESVAEHLCRKPVERPAAVRPREAIAFSEHNHEDPPRADMDLSSGITKPMTPPPIPFIDNSTMLEAANRAAFARWRAQRHHPAYQTDNFFYAPVIWYASTLASA